MKHARKRTLYYNFR